MMSNCYTKAMEVLPENLTEPTTESLPDTVAELKEMLLEKLAIIEQHEKTIRSSEAQLKVLQEKLNLLNHDRFAKSSEKSPGQAEFQFLNEAELLLAQKTLDELKAGESSEDEKEVSVAAHTRQVKHKRQLPADLPRCEVTYDLTEEQKQCSCGKTLKPIGEEVLEQLSIVPQQHYVIVHRKLKNPRPEDVGLIAPRGGSVCLAA